MDIKIPILKDEQTARKKAVETLMKIWDDKMLTTDTIQGWIADFHKRESQNSVEVFNTIERNITELDTSWKAIDQMSLNMTEASHKHALFFKSWSKITAPINEYGSDWERLMISKKNMSWMTHNLDMYVRIQDQIKEMRQLWKEDSNIVVVFKQVRYWSYLRIALLQRVKSQARSDKWNNLADHWMCVREFEDEFFEKFWGYFGNITKLAVEKPEFLVKLVRLIEEDPGYLNNIRKIFKTNSRPDDKYQGWDTSIGGSQGKSRETSHIRDTVVWYEDESESWSEILKSKIPEMITTFVQTRFKDKQTREEILDETLKILQDLFLVKTRVVQCFPAKYDIFEIYKDNYLSHIKERITPFLNQEELEKTPGLWIPIAHWLDQFGEHLQKVGIDLGQTDVITDVEYYMHWFYDHINEVWESNWNTVILKNREDKQAIRDMKKWDLDKIQSFYATDIYSSWINVVDWLSGDFKGQWLFQIVKTIFEKWFEWIKAHEDEIDAFTAGEELIVSCVYVSDASQCLEIFPTLKKKVKALLPKDLYQHIKLRFVNSTPSIWSMYNNNIRKGCTKVIHWMLKECERNCFRKVFTNEWDNDVLEGVFGTFKEYFNRGFVKILKTQNNLLIIVRCFIESFVNYYIEELIHSIRSWNRKLFKGQGHTSALVQYKLKYITIDPDEIVYAEKKENLHPHEGGEKDKDRDKDRDKDKEEGDYDHEDGNIAQGVKDLDKETKKEGTKFKKYKYPVKKFNKDSKVYDPHRVWERILLDWNWFSKFLTSFTDEAPEPFSKNFTQTLGTNYINAFINKFVALVSIMKCHSSAWKEQIIQFKEHYASDEGKVWVEALWYVREDTLSVTKADMKMFLWDAFNVK